MKKKTILYGVEKEKKFPLDSRAHVVSAVKFFNYVDSKYEKELATKLIRKVKEYNISLTPSDKNRFYNYYTPDEYIEHFGLKGMKWGVRRYQNPDGTYNAAGRARYGIGDGKSYHSISSGSKSKSTSQNSSSSNSFKKKGLSTKQKVAIGAVAGVAAGVGAYMVYKKVKAVKLHKIERQNAQAQYFIDSLAKTQKANTVTIKPKVMKTVSSKKKAVDTSSLQKMQNKLKFANNMKPQDASASSTKDLLKQFDYKTKYGRVSGKEERQAAKATMRAIKAENSGKAQRQAAKDLNKAARSTMKSIKAENKAANNAYRASQKAAKAAAKQARDRAWYTSRTGYNSKALKEANERISQMAGKTLSEVKADTSAIDYTKELLKSQADIDRYFLG